MIGNGCRSLGVSACGLFSGFEELGEDSAVGFLEFAKGAGFDEGAIFQDVNAISVADRAASVGDGDGRAPFDQTVDRFLDVSGDRLD